MTVGKSPSVAASVFDSRFPWKLPRLDFEFAKYPYKMTVKEWKSYRDRARQGDAEAQWEVAGRYFDGCKDRSGRIVVKRSMRKGIEWLRRAAENGSAPAQCHLGVLLGDGNGMTENPREALVWLKRAFRGGDSYVAVNIAITYREIGNLRHAVRWFRKSVALGDDGALIQLGIHCFWGRGVRANAAAAVRYFRKATTGKNLWEFERDDAFFFLGIAYLEGRGVKLSIPTARRMLKRANVDNDHPAARSLLATLGASRNS